MKKIILIILTGLFILVISGCTNLEKTDQKENDKELIKDFEISSTELYKKIKNNESFKLLDVREDNEYEEGHIKNTLLLSVNKISQEELDKLGLKKDDEIILYCRSGRRSANAYEMLNDLGYNNVKSLYEGLVNWEEDKYPIESS